MSIFQQNLCFLAKGFDKPCNEVSNGVIFMRSKLKEILRERGVKQKWLCERVGLSTSAMSQIVRGESLPTLSVAIRIAKALNMSVEDIWEE
ncbi:helix-turn-helix transcriptional regulator [Brevibacillus laterosporus]|uniref:helix-turn-helix transcriptional regulator n=1 Tax=Brevibacillus laterosporus TaxID=1465 RepID=UPI003F58EB3A